MAALDRGVGRGHAGAANALAVSRGSLRRGRSGRVDIAVARLPVYAPELNPVGAIWAYLKKHEIANLCLDTIGEGGQFARNRLKSMQRRSHLITAFWKQAELAF